MKVKAALALVLALLVLALFVFAVGWEEVLGAAARAHLVIYAGAFVAMGWCLLARSLVWHRVLSVVDQPRPYWLVGSVFLTAMFAKYVTPYGQVASGVGMAAVVSRYYESAYEESLAGIISADFLNYVPYYTFGSIGVVYLLMVESVSLPLRGYAALITGLVIVIAVTVSTLWRRRDFVERGIVRVTGTVRSLVALVSERRARQIQPENVKGRLEGFYFTLDLLSRDRRTMVTAVVFAHAGWLGLATALYLSALAVGVPIAFGLTLLCVAVSKFGFLMPTPGGVGGVEIALAGALYLVTPMGAAVATAVAILFRFATYWFTIFVGGASSIALTMADPTPP